MPKLASPSTPAPVPTPIISKTRVFVQQDGVVIHEHPGVKGLHGPWTRHNGGFHDDAATPSNVGDLNAAQLAQYAEALGGRNFSFMWVKGTADRKAVVVADGRTWGYGKTATPATVALQPENPSDGC